MKKLICAAMVAGSMFAMAEEAAKPAEAAPAAAAVKAEAAVPAAKPVAKVGPRRSQISPEQRAKMREQREKFMAERKVRMEAQLLEVVKKYVSDEDQAKALVKEIQDTVLGGRRMMRPPRPSAEKPAEAK